MKHPRIDALDLRRFDPHYVWAEDDDELDINCNWDWPELPDFLKRKIVTVEIKADMDKFQRQLAEMSSRVSVRTYDPLYNALVGYSLFYSRKSGYQIYVHHKVPSRWMRFLSYFGLAPAWR